MRTVILQHGQDCVARDRIGVERDGELSASSCGVVDTALFLQCVEDRCDLRGLLGTASSVLLNISIA